MSNSTALTRLADAMVTVADGAGRIQESDLKRLGFDEEFLRAEGGDAVRFAMTRETTTIQLEIVRSPRS